MKKWYQTKYNCIHKPMPFSNDLYRSDHHNLAQHNSINKGRQHKQVQLPGVLAQQILEQEFVCQSGDISNTQIAVLTSLYTYPQIYLKRAVEYFQAHGSEKYKQYQKRMEKFLQKGSIDEFLRGHSVDLARRRDQNDLVVRESRIKSKGEVNRIMVEVQKKVDKNKHIVSKHIAEQESTLQQRMRKRGTRSTTTSKTRAEEEQMELSYPKSLVTSDHSPFSIDLEHFMKRPF